MPSPEQVDPNLDRAIRTGDRRYDEANVQWFDLLANDAVVYSIGGAEPFQGRAAYQAHFEPELTRTRRETTPLNRTAQAVDGAAVVAQTLQIRQEGLVINVRQSVVWRKSAGSELGWQISHLHTALLGTPSPIEIPTESSAVRY
jgi:hypothetical protein